MLDDSWVKIAEYPDLESAERVASRLDGIVPSSILDAADAAVLADHVGQCFLWVPEQSAEEASFLIAEPIASDAELTKLALESPPPDDA